MERNINSRAAEEVPARTLADRAHAVLRRDVLNGRHPPGARLRPAELQRAYGLGLTPVREALMRLAAEGLLTAEGQRGFAVAGLSATELLDIMNVRRRLEAAALRDAIGAGDAEWEAAVVASFHRLARTPLPTGAARDALAEDWERQHRAFHDALIAACGSPWTLRMIGQLVDQSLRYRRARLLKGAPGLARDVDAEHRALMDAALARDADKAARLLDRHLERTTEFVVGLWGAKAGGKPSARKAHMPKR